MCAATHMKCFISTHNMVSRLLNIPWSVGNECFTLSLTQNAIIGHFKGSSTEGCPKTLRLMHYCQQYATDERLLAPALELTKDDRWILLTKKIFEESPNEYWISSLHPSWGISNFVFIISKRCFITWGLNFFCQHCQYLGLSLPYLRLKIGWFLLQEEIFCFLSPSLGENIANSILFSQCRELKKNW